jgi:hypothetical protein
MRLSRLLFAVALGIVPTAILAADPVTVELRERATVGTSVVTLGEVALISGGDANTRAMVSRIDIAELKSRDAAVTLGKRSVEYRLLLAGFDANGVRVTGAEKSVIALAKRAITVEEVLTVAKAELLRGLAGAESVAVELAVPVVVKLPEVPADERPVITAKPRGQVAANGRVQMDVSIASGGTTLLSFAVYLDVKSAAHPEQPVMPAAGTAFANPNAATTPQPPAAPASTAVIIRPRQRVSMEVRTGGLTVKAVGEAQQEGRLGQMILVQNVDSKKSIMAKVTGPSTVEVDIGGSP